MARKNRPNRDRRIQTPKGARIVQAVIRAVYTVPGFTPAEPVSGDK